MKTIYFDHSATTPVKREVLNAMIPYFEINYGNPSALYSLGRNSKRAIEQARRQVATALNCKSEEIYFTSCGSESDNLAIKGFAYANRCKGNHIITSKIEHHAVLNTCKTLEKAGFEVTYLNVDEKGFININELKKAIKKSTILISIMTANNEIGTIQRIKEIGQIAHQKNIVFHTDAVQAIGNIKIDVQKMNIDMLSMSAHKFYGPKGIGALYVKDGVNFDKIQDGGHQEKDKRAGTENVAGIVGMGKAAEIAFAAQKEREKRVQQMRDYLMKKLCEEIPYCRINGSVARRLPGNCNVSFQFIEGNELLLLLDDKNICASAASACSTGNTAPSHVLTAMGIPEKLARGTLRLTIGYQNTQDEIDYTIKCIKEAVKKLRENAEDYRIYKENFPCNMI